MIYLFGFHFLSVYTRNEKQQQPKETYLLHKYYNSRFVKVVFVKDK